MKIFLIIILFILSLVIFLLLSKVRFNLYYDGNIRFSLKFFFLRYGLEFPILYKNNVEEESDIDELLIEAQNSKKSTNESSENSKTNSNDSENENNNAPFPGVKNALSYFKEVVISLFGKIIHSFRLEELTFKGVVGSDNAADTATLYGHMCTIASAIHQFATNAKGMKENKVFIQITPDFLAQSADFYADIKFSIPAWKFLFLVDKILTVRDGYKEMAVRVENEKTNKNTDSKNKTTKCENSTKK